MNLRNNMLLYLVIAFNFQFLSSMRNGQKNVDYREASTIIVTKRNPKTNKRYAILGREAFGSSKGLWDNFGGGKDNSDNNNYLSTALRELQEESIYCLGKDVDVRAKLKKNRVIINPNPRIRSVTYIATFGKESIDNMKNRFYEKRSRTKKFCCREKDRIAFVNYDNLKDVINNAPRDVKGNLKTPIYIKGSIINPKDTSKKGAIRADLELRPFFVDKLQGLI